jgi:hypothetical protein
MVNGNNEMVLQPNAGEENAMVGKQKGIRQWSNGIVVLHIKKLFDKIE